MLYLIIVFTDALPQIIFSFLFQLIYLKTHWQQKIKDYKLLLKMQMNSLWNEGVLEMPKEDQGRKRLTVVNTGGNWKEWQELDGILK